MSLPSSIIIVGSGVFGLSTAYALSLNPHFATTQITLIDRWEFEPGALTTSLHNPSASNADTTRVIRRDYPHGPYASLAAEAMVHWRGNFGSDNRYVNQRLLFSGEGSSLSIPELKKGETVNYIKKAYEISCGMTKGGKQAIQVVDSLDDIRGLLGNTASRPAHLPKDDDNAIGLRGYISEDCGWADAGRSIEWLRQEVRRLGRVQFVVGHVQELVYRDDKAEAKGVRLGDGRVLTADVTVVAAGARSSQLVNLPKLCDVYSEFVAYIQLTDAEAEELRRRNWPILVNCHRGVFAVGPDHENCLKFGHFSYSGIVDVLNEAGIDVNAPTRPDGWETQKKYWNDPRFGFGGDIKVSPLGDIDNYESAAAQRALADYRLFLLELLGPTGFQGVDSPSLGGSDILLNNIANRPFTRVRKCWYNDTPALDFVVDYHPSYGKSLFMATGGCDHAFKFLPIIGDKVVALLLHNRGHPAGILSQGVEPALEELADLWRFPSNILQEHKSVRAAKL